MSQSTDLEARITALEDIEAITKLKSKYWRCVDGKLWDELSECFSEDATTDYGPTKRVKGRKAIIDFFRERSTVGRPSIIGVHHGHNPEIELNAGNSAKGTWQLFHYTIDTQTNTGRRHAGSYSDEYVKEKSGWKIKSTQTINIFREEFDRERQGLKLIQ